MAAFWLKLWSLAQLVLSLGSTSVGQCSVHAHPPQASVVVYNSVMMHSDYG